MSTRFMVKLQYKTATGGTCGTNCSFTLSSGWNAAEVKAQFKHTHPNVKEITILDHKALN